MVELRLKREKINNILCYLQTQTIPPQFLGRLRKHESLKSGIQYFKCYKSQILQGDKGQDK